MSELSIFDLIFCSLLGFYCPDPPIASHLDNSALLLDCRVQGRSSDDSLAIQHKTSGHFAAWGAGFYSDNKEATDAQKAVFWQKGDNHIWSWLTASSKGWREWEIIQFNQKTKGLKRETLSARSPQDYEIYQRDMEQIPEEFRKNNNKKTREAREFPHDMAKQMPISWHLHSFVTEQASCQKILNHNDYIKAFKRDFTVIDRP